MRRHLVLVLFGLLAAPAAAHAQSESLLPHSRISITPFFGARLPYTATERLAISYEEERESHYWEEERNGGAAVGAELEVRALGPVGIISSIAYSHPGNTVIPLVNNELYRDRGATVWLAKAGVSVRLPESVHDTRRFRPVAFVWAGPALIRQQFASDPEIPAELTNPLNHFAANVGMKAVAPLGASRFAFQFALEDYMTFWNRAAWEQRWEKMLLDETGFPIQTQYTPGTSHILMIRTGLTLRL